ncbi:LGFP repeat-containing protein [Blastococcus aurantiacus]|uniref:LGFP repeat-containing protein n=1 Tax=Blastococcus aurantiacus TaxID=1550231 RepID=A0A1G7NUW5_9ACTN|nr:Ig-like domain-containing protein [Blastococcus aurantiacus]SDF77119.1 LGFP repeat-containing protein [Blastococcus aurantiacus]
MRSWIAAVAAALVLLPAAPASAANRAPVAVHDVVRISSAAAGTDVVVPALANDTDPDGDPLSYTAVTAATKGTTSLRDGQIVYRPTAVNGGADSFTYRVTDGQGNIAAGTVAVTLWADVLAPTGLTIGPADANRATLAWSAAPGAVAYQVFRRSVLVHTTSELGWTDAGLSPDTQYGYRVASVSAEGLGGPPSSRMVFRQAQLSTPSTPVVHLTDSPTSLSVSWWERVGPGPWNVYRDGVLVATTPRAEIVDPGLVTGRQYSYQVQSVEPSTATSVVPPSPLSGAGRGTPGVLTDIIRLYQDIGGARSYLGPVTVAERVIPGGRQQDHRNGLILQQNGRAPWTVEGDVVPVYTGAGGARGALGFPRNGFHCDPQDGGCAQGFQGGTIWTSRSTPARVVRSVMTLGWEAAGGRKGRLGYPTAAENCRLRDGGCVQTFQGGLVYWSRTTGAQPVLGAIRTAYAKQGWETGRLGYPTAGEACVLRSGGCFQQFQGGSIYWSPASGAHVVLGAIRDGWADRGSETGRLGYPVGSERCGLRGGGCFQEFQGGAIYWSPASGAHPVVGGIRDAWARQRWETGRLGYPTSAEILWVGSYVQTFQGGTIMISAAGTRITYR